MSDMTLLIFGIVVFSLMLAGAVMTVVEFRQLSEENPSGVEQKPGKPGSDRGSRGED